MGGPEKKYTAEELKAFLQNTSKSEVRIPLDRMVMSQEVFDIMVDWLSDPEDFDPTLTFPDVSDA